MMTGDNINHWNMLTQAEQNEFIEKARYLINRGYILEIDVTPEILAEKIYLSTLESNDDPTDNTGLCDESN